MKIHDWCCQGLSASSDSYRRTVEAEIDAQIPAVITCRASSGHDHRDNGWSQVWGGWQANAFTSATPTGVNIGVRPARFASANDAAPGVVWQRCRHLRAVSSHTPSSAAIVVFG